MDTYQCNLMDKKTLSGFMPTMKAYILEKNDDKPRPIIIICPGGAYNRVVENWEGERIAMAYIAAGFNAAVVNYCVAPDTHPLPLYNVAKAIEICRQNSEKWQIDRNKIVVCGFSAGGHLAASISTLWNNEMIFSKYDIENKVYMPNASILCYPVITSGEKTHKDSMVNLIGSKDQKNEKYKLLSLENQVNKFTPPAFLWHTYSDELVPVENSLYYVQALRKYNIPFELHIYPNGKHGLSLTTKGNMRTKSIFDREYGWMKLSIDWVNELFN